MTANLFESHVGVPDLQPLFEVPDWLHVSLSPELSRGGRLLCDTFLRVACLILQSTPPRRLVVSSNVIGGALNIRFDISPQCRPFEHAALTTLHIDRSLRDSPERRKPLPVTRPSRTPPMLRNNNTDRG